jgi:hypothetical protein
MSGSVRDALKPPGRFAIINWHRWPRGKQPYWANYAQILPAGPIPYFVIIDRAPRDEGTNYHYAEPFDCGEADPELISIATDAVRSNGLQAIVGPTWTTDAPFRETFDAIAAAQRRGILAVEMEAAALSTFAKVNKACVLCLAHVTNAMGRPSETSTRKRRTERRTRARFWGNRSLTFKLKYRRKRPVVQTRTSRGVAGSARLIDERKYWRWTRLLFNPC